MTYEMSRNLTDQELLRNTAFRTFRATKTLNECNSSKKKSYRFDILKIYPTKEKKIAILLGGGRFAIVRPSLQ